MKSLLTCFLLCAACSAVGSSLYLIADMEGALNGKRTKSNSPLPSLHYEQGNSEYLYLPATEIEYNERTMSEARRIEMYNLALADVPVPPATLAQATDSLFQEMWDDGLLATNTTVLTQVEYNGAVNHWFNEAETAGSSSAEDEARLKVTGYLDRRDVIQLNGGSIEGAEYTGAP